MNVLENVLDFIVKPTAAIPSEIALKVFRHQFDNVSSYRLYCQDRGVVPSGIRSVDGIPFVSTAAFKYANLSQNVGSAPLVFLTSGTTQGRYRRGRHVVPYPEVYRASALAHLRSMLFPDGARPWMLAMHPAMDVMPESSLSTMISWCVAEFGSGTSLFAAKREGVDLEASLKFLKRARIAGEAVCILATTAAFAALCANLEESRESIPLAAGSRLMDTGGAKGQVIPLTAPQVIERAQKFLGIEADLVINEYGMTELCSQLYDATAFNCSSAASSDERVKIAPPWLDARALDPSTMSRVPDGEPGMLAFFDLANVGSVSAVMTEDLGIVEGNRVRVLGRAAASEARGCALAIGEFEAAEREQRSRRMPGLPG